MKNCEYCGASIDEYAERCPCCGAPALKEEKSVEPQQPQPAPPETEPAVISAYAEPSQSEGAGGIFRVATTLIIGGLFLYGIFNVIMGEL